MKSTCLSVNIDNLPVSVSKQVESLGVILNSTLSFEAHIITVPFALIISSGSH